MTAFFIIHWKDADFFTNFNIQEYSPDVQFEKHERFYNQYNIPLLKKRK